MPKTIHWLNSQLTWVPDFYLSTDGETIWLESYSTWVSRRRSEELAQCTIAHILRGCVNSCVPTTVRHGTSLHRICPKLFIDSTLSWLESQTSVRQPTVKLFGLSPILPESRCLSVDWRWNYLAQVLVNSSPRCLSVDCRWNYLARVPVVCRPTDAETVYSHPSCLSFDRHNL